MKQEDKQYEKWLAEVKSRQPILDNPEELTASTGYPESRPQRNRESFS